MKPKTPSSRKKQPPTLKSLLARIKKIEQQVKALEDHPTVTYECTLRPETSPTSHWLHLTTTMTKEKP